MLTIINVGDHGEFFRVQRSVPVQREGARVQALVAGHEAADSNF